MKVTGVDVHTVAPIGETVVYGQDVSWLFVEVRTDEGLTGLGECTNWPRHGNALIRNAVETVAPTLVGRDPASIEATWIDLFRRFTYLGGRGLPTALISGIDIALWDLKGKALGRPVYDLLGGRVRDAVPLYRHPGGSSWPGVVESALALVDEGYEAFKLDPFSEMGRYHTAYVSGEISKRGIRAAAEAIELVRNGIGPDVELLIDLHGNYNVASALRCIRALEPYDIAWFEEPLPPESIDALRRLRTQTDAPLCVGERLYTRWDFLPVFRDGLADFVMPDVCWTGGISELKKIATLAEAHAVPIAPHGALGPVQTIASAHVALGVPNLYRLELIAPQWTELYDACLAEPLDLCDGSLRLSDRPGLGVELDRDYLRAHAA